MTLRNSFLFTFLLPGLVLLLTASARAETGMLTTIAGNGVQGYCGDGELATDACLYWPTTLAFDCAGNMYIGDYFNHRIRKVDAASGVISTVAGSGQQGFCGDGGPATDACLDGPGFVTVDCQGNVFFGDVFNNRIRRVDVASGTIETIVGDGTYGFCGDGGPGVNACLRGPIPTLDANGNLYFADVFNHRVRHWDATTGIITTVVGNGSPGFCGDGGPALDACLKLPHGLWLHADRYLYIADLDNYRIRRVDLVADVIATVAGDGTPWNTGDGRVATSAGIGRPAGLSLDAAGNLLIASIPSEAFPPPTFPGHVFRRVDADSGVITTIAGVGTFGFSADCNVATEAELAYPMCVVTSPDGNLVICDQENNRVRVIETVDGDGDAVTDSCDNCLAVANADQRDTDGDDFGNLCDADLNNDCIVNPVDLGTMKSVFFTADPDADLNGDGAVNPIDLGLLKTLFFLPPGPSGVANACDSP